MRVPRFGKGFLSRLSVSVMFGNTCRRRTGESSLQFPPCAVRMLTSLEVPLRMFSFFCTEFEWTPLSLGLNTLRESLGLHLLRECEPLELEAVEWIPTRDEWVRYSHQRRTSNEFANDQRNDGNFTKKVKPLKRSLSHITIESHHFLWNLNSPLCILFINFSSSSHSKQKIKSNPTPK